MAGKSSILKRAAGHVARPIAYAMWKRRHRDALIIFNYHQATPRFDPRVHLPGTWTALDALERQLGAISRAMPVLPLGEALQRWRTGNLRGLVAALTFDDGDAGVERYIHPMLTRLGLPATFFINTAHFDGMRQHWVRVLTYLTHRESVEGHDVLSPDLRVDAARLRRTDDPAFYQRTREAVEAAGERVAYDVALSVACEWLESLDPQQFAVGLHGHEHQRFSMMPEQWQRDNITSNLAALRDLPVFQPVLALPFGEPIDWTPATLAIARELDLPLLDAAGGVNLSAGDVIHRIRFDGRVFPRSLMYEVVGW